MPSSIAPNTILNIEVKLIKGPIAQFAKYEMEVPEGFEANDVESKNGFFTFKKNLLKIVWVTIPADPEIIISFKLKSSSTAGPITFKHQFYYIENNEKKEQNFPPINAKIDQLGANKTISYLPEKQHEAVLTNTPAITNPINPSTSTTEKTINSATISASVQPTKTEQLIPVNEVKPLNSGLIYLVQIGSFSSDPGKAKFNHLGKVTIDKVGNAYKVLIGDFTKKEEAFKKREDLIIKGYDGFVVTFQNGQKLN